MNNVAAADPKEAVNFRLKGAQFGKSRKIAENPKADDLVLANIEHYIAANNIKSICILQGPPGRSP